MWDAWAGDWNMFTHTTAITTAAAWTTIQLRFAMFVCPSTPADKWSTETLFVSSDKSIKASSRAFGSIGNDGLGNSKRQTHISFWMFKIKTEELIAIDRFECKTVFAYGSKENLKSK